MLVVFKASPKPTHHQDGTYNVLGYFVDDDAGFKVCYRYTQSPSDRVKLENMSLQRVVDGRRHEVGIGTFGCPCKALSADQSGDPNKIFPSKFRLDRDGWTAMIGTSSAKKQDQLTVMTSAKDGSKIRGKWLKAPTSLFPRGPHVKVCGIHYWVDEKTLLPIPPWFAVDLHVDGEKTYRRIPIDNFAECDVKMLSFINYILIQPVDFPTKGASYKIRWLNQHASVRIEKHRWPRDLRQTRERLAYRPDDNKQQQTDPPHFALPPPALLTTSKSMPSLTVPPVLPLPSPTTIQLAPLEVGGEVKDFIFIDGDDDPLELNKTAPLHSKSPVEGDDLAPLNLLGFDLAPLNNTGPSFDAFMTGAEEALVKYASLSTEHDNALLKVADLEAKLAQAQRELGDFKREFDESKHLHDQVKLELGSTKLELDELKQQLATTQGELKTRKEHELQLDADLMERDNRIQRLEGELAHKRKADDQLQHENVKRQQAWVEKWTALSKPKPGLV